MLAVAGLLGTSLAFAALEDEIRARLQPAGEVCVMGSSCAQGLAMAGGAAAGAKDPETVYQTFCFACHGTGANNAPVMGNAEHWAPRLEKGIETLYEHSIAGFNNGLMPPKGLCMDCTDEELHATVDYMLEGVQ
jgi:cytochrome c5